MFFFRLFGKWNGNNNNNNVIVCDFVLMDFIANVKGFVCVYIYIYGRGCIIFGGIVRLGF